MRIPFPERIPIWYVCVFAGLLYIMQTVQHTDPIVAICCLIFVVTAGVAFNVAGGLTRPSGSYVFFFAVLAVIMGLTVKAVLWEPADSNLIGPRLTFEIYAGGMIALLGAVFLSRRFSRQVGYLEEMARDADLRMAAIGCVFAGIAIPFVASFYQGTDDTLFQPLVKASGQLNRFLPMAIILGVTYEIKRSGGRRSFNLWVLISAGAIFFDGVLLSYSKEALFLPPVCWLAAAAALGYRFRIYQIAAGLVFLFLINHYMVPYCQYGRIYRNPTATFSENFANSRMLLSDLPEVIRLYKADLVSYDEHPNTAYFNQPVGLFDRLQMVSFDDALIQVTEEKGPLGFAPVLSYVYNIVPHFIWKNKPDITTANFYGHEVGLLAESDDETSISFSPMGEAFRLEAWAGIFVLAPIVWFILFIMTDSLCGDLRNAPWGILAFAFFAHVAPEGGMGGCIYQASYGTFIISFVAFFSVYVMPILASFVSLPTRPSFTPFRNVRAPIQPAPLVSDGTPPIAG